MHGGQIFRLPLGISWQHWIHTPKPVLLWLRLYRGWSSFLVLYLACFHTSFGWICLGIFTGSFRAPITIIEKRAKAHTLVSPAPFAMWQSVMTHRNKSEKRVDAVQPESEMPCWHFDRPYFDSKTNSEVYKIVKGIMKGCSLWMLCHSMPFRKMILWHLLPGRTQNSTRRVSCPLTANQPLQEWDRNKSRPPLLHHHDLCLVGSFYTREWLLFPRVQSNSTKSEVIPCFETSPINSGRKKPLKSHATLFELHL